MHLLVTYDISDDKRRRKIERELSEYGYRVNYSVFEVETNKTGLNRLVSALHKYSSPKEDHIRVYVLCKESLKKSFVLHSEEEVFTYETYYF
jgi:CRISPR-associated protein Cas2